MQREENKLVRKALSRKQREEEKQRQFEWRGLALTSDHKRKYRPRSIAIDFVG